MPEHYNLYYLFLEDKKQYPLSEQKKKEIQQNIDNIFNMINPPDLSTPLKSNQNNNSDL